MQEAADLTAALAAVRSVASRSLTASDDELLADGAAIEALGRIVDGLRVRFAGEVEHRSRKTLGEESLAFRHGARDGVELVMQTTRVDHRTAKARVGLGTAIRPAVGMLGGELPGRLPVVRTALEAGEVGVESARVIANTIKHLRRRVMADALDELAETLTVEAKRSDTETLHEVAAVWASALDPDGAEPRDDARRRRRAAKLGRTLMDGTTTLSVTLLPEHLALVRELFASRRRDGDLDRIDAASADSDETLGPEWRPIDGRTQHQQDYDTLIDAIDLAARVENDPHLAETVTGSSAIAHEVVVHATAHDLAHGHGVGWTAGVLAGLSIPTIEAVACSGGTRLLVTGHDGEVLHLGHSRRLFSSAQKKALTARAGGRCQYPGCRTPAPYLHAHHVDWWQRDAGPTDIGNGLMLCSHHHHQVHAKNSPVRITTGTGGRHHFAPSTGRGQPARPAATGPWTSRLRPPPDPDDPWHSTA